MAKIRTQHRADSATGSDSHMPRSWPVGHWYLYRAPSNNARGHNRQLAGVRRSALPEMPVVMRPHITPDVPDICGTAVPDNLGKPATLRT